MTRYRRVLTPRGAAANHPEVFLDNDRNSSVGIGSTRGITMTTIDTESHDGPQLFENIRAAGHGKRIQYFDYHTMADVEIADAEQYCEYPENIPAAVDLHAFHEGTCKVQTLYADPEHDGISLGVYTFPPNFSFPRHFHDCDQIVFVLEGSVSTGNKQLRPGRGLLHARRGDLRVHGRAPRCPLHGVPAGHELPDRVRRGQPDALGAHRSRAQPSRPGLTSRPRRGQPQPATRTPHPETSRAHHRGDRSHDLEAPWTAHDHRSASACSSRRTTRRRRTRPSRCSATSSSSSTSRTSASTRPGSASTTRPAGSTSARPRCSSRTRQRRRAASSSARAWSRCPTTTRSWPPSG